MSFDDQSPYQSPQPAQSSPMGKPVGNPVKKPTGLIAIGVIALIFGIMGVISGCCGVITPLFQDQFLDLMDSMVAQGASGEEAELQQQTMRAGIKAAKPLMIPSMIAQLIGLVISIGLVVGGIAALKGSANCRILLGSALLLCVPSVIANTVLASIISARTNAIQTELYEEAGLTQQAEAMGMFSTFGLAMQVGFALLMVILYAVLGLYILKSKPIREYVEQQTDLSMM